MTDLRTVAQQEQDIEDAIEAAYWHFDARKKGLNEWASAPQSERDAFKAEARKLAKGYFPTQQAQDTKREMLAVADAFIRGKRAALAEPVQEPVTRLFGTLPVYDTPPQRPAEPEYPLGQASTDVGVPVFVVKKAEPPCNPSCAPGYCYCEPVQEPQTTKEPNT